MEDFNALASTLAAGVADVRGCVILSGDGLILGSHPDDAQERIRPAWLRFASLGDPERGFAQFGFETWCFVRRGPYAAFAVVGPGARAGLVIDQMEQVLLAAEQARSRLDAVRDEPAQAAAPSAGPRTALHPGAPLEEPIVLDVPVGAARAEAAAAAKPAEPSAASDPAAAPAPEPSDAASEGDADDEDVDRFSLSMEFGGLLQDREDGADG